MGEVYRAEDTKLGRDVAIKVLPAEVAENPERLERFQREARTIASLNHPNIVTLYSVEEAEGIHFLAMELVAGKTLDALTPPDGLSLDRFFELATPIADALATAHSRGIVHRDLKPGNVMVTDEGDRVKVLDFGLAKLTEADLADGLSELPTEALTQEGLIVGTPHYMSPEQAKGEAVDQRSDIFSLGVLLYEMATGKRPFQGASSIELLSSVIKDSPPTITEVKPNLPRHLGRIIGRSLEKAPVDRYQTARDIYNELRALRKESSSGTAARTAATTGSDTEHRRLSPEAPWIAVLPLKCQNADPDLEAFADGLTEDITTGLSRFSYLLVVSRSSTRKLEGQAFDARQAGQELGARYAIEGSLRKSGSRIRLSVQAVDARTGTHLWAETFDRNLSGVDIFDVQDEITDRVVATVADPFGVLARSMAAPTATKLPEELSPYEAILRFFLYQQRVSAEDHLPTRIALERAVELEPENPDAWGALTIVLIDEDRHTFNPRPDALDRALKAARRAVEADPANQMANYALAAAHYYRREVGAFRAAAEHAISLNPRDSNIMAILGILMGYAGDWERGVELTTKAMELNPHHPGWYRFTTFFNSYHQKRYEEALAIVQKMNLSEYFATHYATAIAQAQLGNISEAQGAVQECLRLWPEFEQGILSNLEKWMYAQPDLIEHIVEGLELAGLDVRGAGERQGADG
jgi:serine/threonine protein kinase/cytochrome c-type biogenesis protein CcmH/NrfG